MQFNNSYATLDTRLFHAQPPTPLDNPRAGHFNPLVAADIGWADDDYLMHNWVDILGGKLVPAGFAPLAMAYAGHQFGHWAGQLGDGRGLLMAQVINKSGQLTDLHLKGMGLTPYSRMGDGRAVLRSTIREYLCGHAMSQLGIASSNALGFVVSDTPVRRETFESGAALMRVSDCHIRLGHVEWITSFAPDLLPSFTDYMIDTYYPECRELAAAKSQSPILAFLRAVVERTAIMIANWQLVGFAHGVMNTDNLSITGSTIDYGPFGFLERFNPAWINNHSDHTGRYSYQNQPAIGHWNLNVWLSHFLRLTSSGVTRAALEECLAHYQVAFTTHYHQGLCHKLGLPYTATHRNHTADNSDTDNHNLTSQKTSLTLAHEFLQFLVDNKLDFTNSFRALNAVILTSDNSDIDNADNMATDAVNYTAPTQAHDTQLLHHLERALTDSQKSKWQQWKSRYLTHLIEVYKQPSATHSPHKHSDSKPQGLLAKPLALLNTHNPIYVLRNTMAQKAIEAGEQGDFSEVDRLFKLLTTPYTQDSSDSASIADTMPPPADAPELLISCSS